MQASISTMSLLNIPAEIILKVLNKLKLNDRINVCRSHPNFFPLCLDRLFDLKVKKSISLYELYKLYQQSRTEKERDQCFDPKILDRLQIDSFNEVVHLDMDRESKDFFSKAMILQSLKGCILVKNENEQFSPDFYQHFLDLLDKIEGNILLAFTNVQELGEGYAELCAQILSKKFEHVQKIFLVDIDLQNLRNTHCQDIRKCMNDGFTIYYSSFLRQKYFLALQPKNCGVDTQILIGMINGDTYIPEKQHLGRILPLVIAAETAGDREDIQCLRCMAGLYFFGNKIELFMSEPEWSDHAGCPL